MSRNFMEMLRANWRETAVCVGLDPQRKTIPKSYWENSSRPYECLYRFGCDRVIATYEHTLAFKPNRSFWTAFEDEGRLALKQVIQFIHDHTNRPVIFDVKEGDIANSNGGYIHEAFEEFNADAVTVHPYMGMEAMQPWLDQPDKGIFVLCHTSNPGADEFQAVKLFLDPDKAKELFNINISSELAESGAAFYTPPMYQYVAARVAKYWNTKGNCGLVLGATYAEQAGEVRKIVGDDVPLLLPGFGKQGASIADVIPVAQNSQGVGILANSSSGITDAAAPGDAAKTLKDTINQYRKVA